MEEKLETKVLEKMAIKFFVKAMGEKGRGLKDLAPEK